MKKLIFGCAALASALVFASSVESSNVFGVLKVDNTDEQVIISVPWVTVGSSGNAISPTDLVCTTDLQENDYMLYYTVEDSVGKYYSWKINSSGAWVSSKVLPDTAKEAYAAGSDKTATRGTDALILVRPGTRSAFYLNGQHKEGTTSVTMSSGTSESPKWTFFAPTSAANVNVNSFTYTETNHPVAGDKIRFGLGKEFYYVGEYDDGGQWYYNKPTTVSVGGQTQTVNVQTTEAVLPAGVAAIYISVGGNPTFVL